MYLRHIRKGSRTEQRDYTFSPISHLPINKALIRKIYKKCSWNIFNLCMREINCRADLDSEAESCRHNGGIHHPCDADGQGQVTHETWSMYELEFYPWGSRRIFSELTLGESQFPTITMPLVTIWSPIQQECKWFCMTPASGDGTLPPCEGDVIAAACWVLLLRILWITSVIVT